MVQEFLQQAILKGNKSTVLKPLRWLIGLSFSATLILAVSDSATWLLIVFMSLSVISVILFIFAYVFCLLKSPENLRSEKYTIQKMAIERGIIGDDIVGQIEIESKKDILILDQSEAIDSDDKTDEA